jgi:two-component system chemotaxis response regulator CheY
MIKFDPSRLTALVIDQSHFQRRLTLEQLRLMGFSAVNGVPSFELAWEAMEMERPHVVLIEWIEPRELALKFVRRVRASPEPYSREVSLLMLTSRGGLTDVESALAAGVDGYLRKPISAQAIQERVRHVFVRPKADPAQAESDKKAQRARALASALEARARALAADETQDARDLRTAAMNLSVFAEEIEDPHLGFGARELTRYIDACGPDMTLDSDAVTTHAAALFQIALLPPPLTNERERLSQNLKRMVDKKMRQAGAA